MLKLLQSLFGVDAKQGRYSESLVKQAIERAVDGTDPWLRGLSGYQKKLRPAVVRAIDHVIALVDRLPAPVPVCISNYTNEPRLKCFFISADEMKKTFARDHALVEFMRHAADDATEVFALLAMEKQERGTFGAALSGDIVIHDVPQVTVSFDGHRLFEPSTDEGETRRNLMRRAFDHLLALALRRIIAVKSERKDLERWRTLLQAKLTMLEREGWGFDAGAADAVRDPVGVEEQLRQIEAQLQEIGGDDRALETYLEIVVDVLGRPEEHLQAFTETIYVNRMGIKQAEASSDAPELTFDELRNTEGIRLAVQLIALQAAELRELCL